MKESWLSQRRGWSAAVNPSLISCVWDVGTVGKLWGLQVSLGWERIHLRDLDTRWRQEG